MLRTNTQDQAAMHARTKRVRTLNDSASWQKCGDPYNIKSKGNIFFEGFVRLSKCGLLTECAQVQKRRTAMQCKLTFLLFAFFTETVSYLITQKNYFVNLYFVTSINMTKEILNHFD